MASKTVRQKRAELTRITNLQEEVEDLQRILANQRQENLKLRICTSPEALKQVSTRIIRDFWMSQVKRAAEKAFDGGGPCVMLSPTAEQLQLALVRLEEHFMQEHTQASTTLALAVPE